MGLAPEKSKRGEELDVVLLPAELLVFRGHEQDTWGFTCVKKSKRFIGLNPNLYELHHL